MNSLRQAEVIRTEQLGRRFGSVDAVQGIDFAVQEGEIFGLVGPDGAGKSTLMRMLTGNLAPSQGKAMVLGFDPSQRHGSYQVRIRIGYLSQGLSLFEDLTVQENLRFCAQLFGVQEARSQIELLLNNTGLINHRQKLASALSGGMRQKLALACALIHKPRLVFLDEPSTGVDPVSRREFWELIGRSQQQGVTFVVSTPYMDEADRCGRVAFMYGGRMLVVDTPDQLKGNFERQMYEVVFPEGHQAIAAARLVEPLLPVRVMGDRLRIFGQLGEPIHDQIQRALAPLGTESVEVRPARPTLEDVFVSLIVARR